MFFHNIGPKTLLPELPHEVLLFFSQLLRKWIVDDTCQLIPNNSVRFQVVLAGPQAAHQLVMLFLNQVAQHQLVIGHDDQRRICYFLFANQLS